MNAFTYCTNMECHKRDKCQRSLSTNDPWQSNAYFSRVLGDSECFGYIPLRVVRTQQRWSEEKAT